MLKINELNVSYGAVHALKDVSLEVNDGELVTLIGANGAGKTTTLHAISGLLNVSSGSIELDGRDLRKTSPGKIIGCGLAHVPEGRHVFSQMTVLENLYMVIVFQQTASHTSAHTPSADVIQKLYFRIKFSIALPPYTGVCNHPTHCCIMQLYFDSRRSSTNNSRFFVGRWRPDMELVAEAQGLGVLYSGFFAIAVKHSAKLQKLMGVSGRRKAVTALVLGYPAVRYLRSAPREPARVTWL